MSNNPNDTYSIKLPQFEGPFDLLLFFIERDELDIYDIPIFKLTQDFLHYIHQMEHLNIELAGEFILVAATLMRIKAKLLLPRKEVNPETGQEIDPREELVTRLIEYKKFKEATELLRQMEDDRQSIAKRGNITGEMSEIATLFETEYEMQSLTMFRLLKAFQTVVTRVERERNKPVHTVVAPAYTIEGEKMLLRELVKENEQVLFEKIFDQVENRVHAIFTFLAMLELIQEQVLTIIVGDGYNNFWIRSKTDEERNPTPVDHGDQP
ncbi:MAG: segregation/condensation protein A [Bacteroidetes bacterium]|nr:segregation/condensation protein A [Bacteroidota bacterium]